MKCENFENQIDLYLSGSGEKSMLDALEQHVSSCTACRQFTEHHQSYITTMKQFESPTLAAGKSVQLLRRAVQRGEEEPASRQQRSALLQGCIAASILAVGIFIGGYFPQLSLSTTPDELIISEAADEYLDWLGSVSKNVTVVIYVPEDMPGALLSLSLPEDIQVEGFEGSQDLSWTTDLVAGANTLSLPIYAKSDIDISQPVKIAASISYKNKDRDFHLMFDLDSPQYDGAFKILPMPNDIS